MGFKGLLDIDWNRVEDYSEEDITYFLYLEGKSIESICKIRNLGRDTIENHIISGKIKYGILAKSNTERDLFKSIALSGKFDKVDILQNLDKSNKNKLLQFIKTNYGNMRTKDKENAVWMLGELKSRECLDILTKAIVHKHVNVRRMAVSAIGKLGDKSGENALMRALDDVNPQVVLYAIKSLIKIKSCKAVKKVDNLKNTACKEYIKKSAEEYLSIVHSCIERGDIK